MIRAMMKMKMMTVIIIILLLMIMMTMTVTMMMMLSDHGLMTNDYFSKYSIIVKIVWRIGLHLGAQLVL